MSNLRSRSDDSNCPLLRDNLDEKGGGDQSFEAAAGSGVMIVADLKLCKGFFGAAV